MVGAASLNIERLEKADLPPVLMPLLSGVADVFNGKVSGRSIGRV